MSRGDPCRCPFDNRARGSIRNLDCWQRLKRGQGNRLIATQPSTQRPKPRELCLTGCHVVASPPATDRGIAQRHVNLLISLVRTAGPEPALPDEKQIFPEGGLVRARGRARGSRPPTAGSTRSSPPSSDGSAERAANPDCLRQTKVTVQEKSSYCALTVPSLPICASTRLNFGLRITMAPCGLTVPSHHSFPGVRTTPFVIVRGAGRTFGGGTLCVRGARRLR